MLIATVFYNFIEMPFQRLGKEIIKRIEKNSKNMLSIDGNVFKQ